MLRRVLLPIALIAAFLGFALVGSAAADHGLGHNGETMELDKTEDIHDGDVVAVALSSFLPGKTATVVTCFTFPATGPADCELSNYGTYTIAIADDGSGGIDYPVSVVPGKCDDSTNCWIVAGDGFGPDANYAGVEIAFAAAGGGDGESGADDASDDDAGDDDAGADDAGDDDAGADDAGDDGSADGTEEAAPAQEEETPTPTATAEPTATPTATPTPDGGDEDGSSNAGPIIAIIIIVVVVAALVAWFVSRRSTSGDTGSSGGDDASGDSAAG